MEDHRGRGFAITGLIAAAVPFVIAVSSSSYTFVNGVGQGTYRDWVAVDGGAE